MSFIAKHGRPHYHAVYGEFEAVIDIETGEAISGKLPKQALGLISEWQSEHAAACNKAGPLRQLSR